MKKTKICLAASSGGHYEQILMLKPLLDKYDGFILTERTKYNTKENNIKIRHVLQVNRKEKSCFFRLLINILISLLYWT